MRSCGFPPNLPSFSLSGSPLIIRRCLDWPLLPRRGFPLIFDGVRGEDVREGTSPSWFNPAEVFVVVKYVKLLLADKLLKLSLNDIGVITPYRCGFLCVLHYFVCMCLFVCLFVCLSVYENYYENLTLCFFRDNL